MVYDSNISMTLFKELIVNSLFLLNLKNFMKRILLLTNNDLDNWPSAFVTVLQYYCVEKFFSFPHGKFLLRPNLLLLNFAFLTSSK